MEGASFFQKITTSREILVLIRWSAIKLCFPIYFPLYFINFQRGHRLLTIRCKWEFLIGTERFFIPLNRRLSRAKDLSLTRRFFQQPVYRKNSHPFQTEKKESTRQHCQAGQIRFA